MAVPLLTTRPRIERHLGARTPARRKAHLLVYITVDCVAATLDAIVAHGSEIVQPIRADAPPEVIARFRDPGGNVIGLYKNLEPRKRDERA
jgi:predicted enzyme related to lactoylglutathione lyase